MQTMDWRAPFYVSPGDVERDRPYDGLGPNDFVPSGYVHVWQEIEDFAKRTLGCEWTGSERSPMAKTHEQFDRLKGHDEIATLQLRTWIDVEAAYVEFVGVVRSQLEKSRLLSEKRNLEWWLNLMDLDRQTHKGALAHLRFAERRYRDSENSATDEEIETWDQANVDRVLFKNARMIQVSAEFIQQIRSNSSAIEAAIAGAKRRDIVELSARKSLYAGSVYSKCVLPDGEIIALDPVKWGGNDGRDVLANGPVGVVQVSGNNKVLAYPIVPAGSFSGLESVSSIDSKSATEPIGETPDPDDISSAKLSMKAEERYAAGKDKDKKASVIGALLEFGCIAPSLEKIDRTYDRVLKHRKRSGLRTFSGQ